MKLDFVGVGPQRAGTTWLHENLINHPSIALPKEPIKETFFFDQYYERGINWYKGHFDQKKMDSTIAVGEIGPSYFDGSHVAERIYSMNPKCKIIINIRNPIEKTYSLYCHYVKLQNTQLEFEKALIEIPRLVDSGRYEAHLNHWLNIFDQSQIHFVVLDDLKANPKRVLEQCCTFLGVSEPDYPVVKEPVNAAYLPKYPTIQKLREVAARFAFENHLYGFLRLGRWVTNISGYRTYAKLPSSTYPEMSSAVRKQLAGIFLQDIEFLEKTLDRKFTNWTL